MHLLRATPSGFNPVNKQDQDRTNALIAVTVSGNTARNLGWNLTQAVTTEPKTPANITWIDSVDPDDPDNQLLVSCKAWWYRE